MATIKYLEFPATMKDKDSITLPITLNLPCYGSVKVELKATGKPTDPQPPPPTLQVPPAVQNKSIGSYSWGIAQDFSVYHNVPTLSYTNINYKVTFTFLDSTGAPEVLKLFLVVAFLARKVEAHKTTVTVSVAGNRVGEYVVPGCSTTLFNGPVLSSGLGGDSSNTGWALYQPSAKLPGTPPSFDIDINQEPGDGIAEDAR